MTTRTYKILTSIPVVGAIVKCVTGSMAVGCSPMMNDGYGKIISEYRKQNPNVQITKKVMLDIFKGDAK